MSFNQSIVSTRQLICKKPQNMISLSKSEVVAMSASWASIDISCDDSFHYRASEHVIDGSVVYYIEQSGLSVRALVGSQDIACVIHVVDGTVLKRAGGNEFVYTPEAGRSTFAFYSEEYAVHEHFNSAIWMLPIVKPKDRLSQKEVGSNLITSLSFSELVALSGLPRGKSFISQLVNRQGSSAVDTRYAGTYSKVLSCLAQKKYSLEQLAYATGLPVSTLAKFKMGDIPIMQFVKSFRCEQIHADLKRLDPSIVAREHGFSSKYKMFDFLNRESTKQRDLVK